MALQLVGDRLGDRGGSSIMLIGLLRRSSTFIGSWTTARRTSIRGACGGVARNESSDAFHRVDIGSDEASANATSGMSFLAGHRRNGRRQ
jgi:hypothetical protein